MDGILIIDKPEGCTSHDVVAGVRRVLKTKRVGHTGTLDPFATGVMVILVGKATRLAQYLDKDEKEYIATVRFGFETDTGDRTGMRTAECGMRIECIGERLAETDWGELLKEFSGEIEQVPPMYSAKKVAGKKLYELARKGEQIERQAATVFIREMQLLDTEFRDPISAIRIRVVCSAGTYIRRLAEDIGRMIGVGAHLQDLRRTRAGRFDLSRSIRLEELQSLDQPGSALIPMADAVSHLPELVLSPDRVEKTKNGLSTRTVAETPGGQAFRMLDEDGSLIAVGTYSEAEKAVKPKVVLI